MIKFSITSIQKLDSQTADHLLAILKRAYSLSRELYFGTLSKGKKCVSTDTYARTFKAALLIEYKMFTGYWLNKLIQQK